jgi:hypothetical protein
LQSWAEGEGKVLICLKNNSLAGAVVLVNGQFRAHVRAHERIENTAGASGFGGLIGDAHARIFGPDQLAEDLKAERSTAIQISLKNLTDLGCISNPSQGMVLSAYGFELMLACDPHHGAAPANG